MLNFFKKLLTPFSKIKSALGTKLREIFSKEGDSRFEEMERLFFESDLGAALALELTEKVRRFAKKNKQSSAEEIIQFLKSELLPLFPPLPAPVIRSPHVILLVGVNGSGKTTTLAKLASFYAAQGKKVLIAAGDTFRAAAVEQLEEWAKRVGVSLVKSKAHSDPSAVAFDALQAAVSRGMDLVLIDTAGRLQTKTNLMQELSKIGRVCQKVLPEAPHETLFVLDATIGQNGLDQAKAFHQFTPISGIVLTKLDASAKGGIALAIQKELKIPIQWIGTGEKEEDLAPFDPKSYLDSLLS